MTDKTLKHMNAVMVYAEAMRKLVSCTRASHAAVLTDGNLEILAVGYNGSERGAPNECERPDEQGNCGCVHAEANALVKPQRQYDGPKIMFVTCEPCERCAKLMVNAGVKMVVFRVGHRPYPDGIRVLGRAEVLFGTPEAMGKFVGDFR